jgi:hypothetical protein
MEPQILIIGRENSRHPVDIAVPASEDTVSARHAQLTISQAGELFLADLGSRNGTFIHKNGKWIPCRQEPIYPETRILFGEFETSGAELAARAPRVAHAPISVYGGPPLQIPAQQVKEIPITPLVPPPPTPKPAQTGETGPSIYFIDPRTGEKVRGKAASNEEAGPRRNPLTGEILGN